MVNYDERYAPLTSSRDTGRQRRRLIYEHICAYAEEMHGPTPNINEIATKLKIDYKVVYYHVMKLIAHRILDQRNGKLIVLDSTWQGPEFPPIP